MSQNDPRLRCAVTVDVAGEDQPFRMDDVRWDIAVKFRQTWNDRRFASPRLSVLLASVDRSQQRTFKLGDIRSIEIGLVHD